MWQWRRRPSERDVDDEIAFHLAEEARLRVERGAAPDDASAAAHRAFGNVTLVREVTRDMWGTRAFASVMQDVRLGLRLLAPAPPLCHLQHRLARARDRRHECRVLALRRDRPAPVAGARARATGHARAALGRPAAQLVHAVPAVRGDAPGDPVAGRLVRQDGASRCVSVGAGGTTGIASAMAVTGAYHGTLGLRPAIGRLLTPDDDRAGAPAVVVAQSRVLAPQLRRHARRSWARRSR